MLNLDDRKIERGYPRQKEQEQRHGGKKEHVNVKDKQSV